MRITLYVDVLPAEGGTSVTPTIAVITGQPSPAVPLAEPLPIVGDAFNVLGQVIEFAKTLPR